MIRTYDEMIKFPSFAERFNFCKLSGEVGVETFGFDRLINQKFYKSSVWMKLRDEIILRDNGCDLAIPGREIQGRIYIHHLNPLRLNDIINCTEYLLDPKYLVCVSHNTHNAIHYGTEENLYRDPIERKSNDMCPWLN